MAAEKLVSDLCARFEQCECEAHTFESTDEGCESSATALVNTWIEAAEALELTYSPTCMAEKPAFSCGGSLIGSTCQVYFGRKDRGERCQAVGPFMSTCGEWLACGVDGYCGPRQELDVVGSVGDRCGASLGDFTGCEQDLACVEGTCVPAAAAEESCDATTPCNATTWCDGGTCAARLGPRAMCPFDAEGLPLSEACEPDLLCDDAGQCTWPLPRACFGFSW